VSGGKPLVTAQGRVVMDRDGEARWLFGFPLRVLPPFYVLGLAPNSKFLAGLVPGGLFT